MVVIDPPTPLVLVEWLFGCTTLAGMLPPLKAALLSLFVDCGGFVFDIKLNVPRLEFGGTEFVIN